MKSYLLLLLFPISSIAQIPLDTDNWDFQYAQQKKMIKLGYHRIDVKSVDTETKTGKVVQTFETWETFDNSGNYISNGLRKNGKDSILDVRSYRADGRYLGEVDQNGNGRTMYYDEHDSLIRIQYIPNHPFSILYFYDQLNDSTTRVREYYSDTTHIQSTETFVRSGNMVYSLRTDISHREPYLNSKRITNELGQVVETWDHHNDCTQRYTYDSLGRTIKREIDQTYSGRKENWEFTNTYDASGSLIFQQKKEKLQGITNKWTYEFKNGLLVKETQFDLYNEPQETVTTYSYYPNGLLKTSSKLTGYNLEYKYVQTYTYR